LPQRLLPALKYTKCLADWIQTLALLEITTISENFFSFLSFLSYKIEIKIGNAKGDKIAGLKLAISGTSPAQTASQ
jgi:hypothetical protein